MALQLTESIIRGLEEAQNSANNHPKLIATFLTLYEKTEADVFFRAFFPAFSNILLVYKREPAVERVVTFVTSFAVQTAPREKNGKASAYEYAHSSGHRIDVFLFSLLVESNDEEEDSDTDEEVEISFFSLLIDRLLTLHQAKDKAVRFRVCQLLAKLLSTAVDSSCIVGSDRLNEIQQAMLFRVHDKIPVVRVHAVAALEFLQDADPDCPVTSTFLEMMAKDSSPDVRRCILNKIAITDRSLAVIIERTRDVKETIRRDAFIWLSSKCSIRNFTISQRIQLLQDGLKDSSELVQEGCVNGLLRSWSMECLDGDFISLLSRLDVENTPEVVELALVKLFDNFSIEDLVTSMTALMAASNEKQESWKGSLHATPTETTPTTGETTPINTLTIVTPSAATVSLQDSLGGTIDPPKLLFRDYMNCEEIFYWSCLCRYLHGKGPQGERGLESIIPTLTEFCDYIQSYVEEVLVVQEELVVKMQSQFVTQQLSSMLAVFDRSDEVGRCRMAELVFHLLMLPKFPVGLVAPFLEQQTHMWPCDTDRIEKLVEVIAELRQPSMVNPKDGCGTSIPASGLLLEESLLSTTFSQGSFLDLQDDLDTLLRCLAITCELLKGLKVRKLDNPALLTLADSLLFPCIQNVNPYVRDMALHCLGLACLLDLTIARNHILLFLQVSQVDHESVQATALKVVFDLLLVYGFEAFNVMPTGNTKGEEKEGEEEEKEEEEEEETSNQDSGKETEAEREEIEGEKDNTTQRLLNIMAKFLEGESMLLREVAGEGICKLLLSHRISSQKLLAKLLLLWYNPVTREETRLQSTLGLFFPSFAALDRNSRLILSEVYLPVMRMVLEAPPTSPLAHISTNNLSDFILQLTHPPNSDEESVHDSLAISVCNEVLCDPQTSDVRVYCRTLSLMELTPSNKSNAADLLTLCEQMSCEVTDKTTIRYLKKFGDTLRKINHVEHTASASKTANEKEEVSDDRAEHTKNTTVTNPLINHFEQPEQIPATTQPPRAPPTKSAVKTKTKPAASSTRNKKTQPSTGTQIQQTVGRKGRRRRVTFTNLLSSSEDESESENIEPEDIASLPRRTLLSRAAKNDAFQRVTTPVATGVPTSSASDDSDDSIVGEHSPFIKNQLHVIRRRQFAKPLQPLQYSDDEEDITSQLM